MSTELSLPETPQTIQWTAPRLLTSAMRNPWTRKRTTVSLGGTDTWRAQLTIVPGNDADARIWRSFMSQAMGTPDHFFNIPLVTTAQHTGANGTVKASSATTLSCVVEGLTPSKTLLVAGQYVCFTGLPSGTSQAVILTADFVSNGAGEATATWKVPLRETPVDGTDVISKSPFVRVAMDQAWGWSEEPGMQRPLGFSVEEAY